MAANTPKASKDLLIKGLLLCGIGLLVLIAPAFVRSPAFAQAVGGSSVVGWFSLVLGIAFLGQWAWHRKRG